MASRTARLVAISVRFGAALTLAVATAALLDAQIPGRNVNMVSGRTLPNGDPFLQRQNEPSIAASSRNPLHLLAGANDYRTVDLPGLPNSNETGDAWMGVFKSYDGGNTWRSTLIPGYPQDANSTSPLKGYAAAADPVVRAGTNGLFFYSGIVFNRDTLAPDGTTIVKGKSAMFVSRFIDNNNQEAGDPIVLTGTSMIEQSPGGIGAYFIDKPWFAVDRPRTGATTCSITTSQRSPTPTEPNRIITTNQSFPGGAAYAVYSRIVGEGVDTRSQIYFRRSLDCGVTWSEALQISSIADPINQGATLAIDPNSGTIYLAWRRFTADGTDDSIMVTRSIDQGRKWDPPGRARRFPRGRKLGLVQEIHGNKFKQATELAQLASLDQPTETYQFRTNAYPTIAIDGTGRVYVAWSERGFAPFNPDPDDGDARILVATSTNGATWTEPTVVANDAVAGHQVMPSMSFAGGKLMIAYYDFREDVSQIFQKFVDERAAVIKRHTVDVRAAMASPAASPEFGESVRVSEYLMGSRPGTGPRLVEQLQFNPPNLKLFKLGTVPFFGDYIDLTPSPAFVPTAGGGWTSNTAPSASPLFHVVWTDNRDVVPPADGNWANYVAPGAVAGTPSFFDGSLLAESCVPGSTSPNNRAGMRNQNIYTARLTGGLVAGSPGNTKTLHPILPRGFAVFAQNATEFTKTFRFRIETQPAGGRASFLQASLLPPTPPAQSPPALVESLDVIVPRRSTVARNVFAVSTIPDAQIHVSVKEIGAVGGNVSDGGLQTTVVLNPDISNPDISNPDISNPDISNPDISNAEVSNPDISNPDISNPDISNPDISNPDISNPDISNVQVANPDISNPDISNPDISNPDISNPDISNPDISNPDISNQSLTDTTWSVTNDGNTTTSYSIKLLLDGDVPATNQILLQLILHKVYTNPVAVNCTLVNHPNNVLLANILHPEFTDPADVGNPDISNPDISNATLWLAPGESAKITLRSFDKNLSDGVTFNAAAAVTPVVVPQALDVALDDNGQLVIGEDVALTVPLNAQFLNLPPQGEAGIPLGTVGVRVMDNGGAVLPGVNVTLSVRTLATNAQIGISQVALTNEVGVASFAIGALPAGEYRLLAQVTRPGFTPASKWSDSFVIVARDVRQWTIAGGGNGNYYEYVRVGGLSWTQARDAAAARSFKGIPGRLVTITSAAENAFVTGLGSGGPLRAWIGMIDPDGPDDIFSFSWITGEAVSYTNWFPGEPNNPGTEFWVELFTDGTWNNNQALDLVFPTLGYIVEYPVGAQTIFVTSSGSSGAGSLRQAIDAANANGPSHDVIRFSIPGTSVHTIALQQLLPAIQHPVTIDGTTQPGYAGSPRIFISGAPIPVIGTNNAGLRVEGANSDIRGLGIIKFQGPGIYLGANGSRVRGNFIGVDGTSDPTTGNLRGVEIHGSNHRIGGTTAADRNVISANSFAGIYVTSDGGSAIIEGNFIGTDPTGTVARGNGAGVLSDDSGGTMIGGSTAGAGNLISANSTGILLTSNNTGIQIHGNFIGTDVTGTLDLGNTGNGIQLNGSAVGTQIGQPGAGNLISGNNSNGILINDSATQTNVRSNRIGTNAAGTAAIFNGTRNASLDIVGAGVQVNGFANQIGRPGTGEGNLISGNGVGVSLTAVANDNIIRGNFIGTTADGLTALGNRFGIFNAGAAGTLIGGTAPGDGNIVSGNTVEGISVTQLRASDVRIEGNRVGTSANGVVPLGGHPFGAITVRFEAKATIGRVEGGGNLIAGNNGTGVRLETNGNTVENNIIGRPDMPNATGGISITGSNNTILLNHIAFNTGVGITASGSGNSLRANFIFSNSGLGIDQRGDGVTPNDGTAEEDGVQNYPVMTSAMVTGGTINIQGALSSTPQTPFHITFFVSSSCDGSGFGEGQTIPFGSFISSTNADGNLDVSQTIEATVTPGQVVTAIARNTTTNDTSEFSNCVTIQTSGEVASASANAGFTLAPAESALQTSLAWRRQVALSGPNRRIIGYRR